MTNSVQHVSRTSAKAAETDRVHSGRRADARNPPGPSLPEMAPSKELVALQRTIQGRDTANHSEPVVQRKKGEKAPELAAPLGNMLDADEFARATTSSGSSRPERAAVLNLLRKLKAVQEDAAKPNADDMPLLYAYRDIRDVVAELIARYPMKANGFWFNDTGKRAWDRAITALGTLAGDHYEAALDWRADDATTNAQPRLVGEAKALPTFDPKAKGGKGAFVGSGGDYNPGFNTQVLRADKSIETPETNAMGYKRGESADDGRYFADADGSDATQKNMYRAIFEVRTIDDIDSLDIDTVKAINPMSLAPYHILHNVLHQNWHLAKEELASPPQEHGVNVAVRRAVMRKLWEYRQWHHQVILEEVKSKLATGQLTNWSAAGSAGLSSDIDVNLKGNATEIAVRYFNEIFKNSSTLPDHRWTVEPGVAYDVNGYAIDFMHAFGGVNVDNKSITKKEGERKGLPQGGISNVAFKQYDRQIQSDAALLKVRIFMTGKQWAAYKASLKHLSKDDLEMWIRVEKDYDQWLKTMGDEMNTHKDAQQTVQDADSTVNSGVQILRNRAEQISGHRGSAHEQDTAQQQLMIGSANRIYERKLETIRGKRAILKTKIEEYNKIYDKDDVLPQDKERLNQQIDLRLVTLRRLIAEASFYANEASITDATVHHGVVAMQGGAEIDQTKADLLNAVHEHMGDSLKELERHGHGGDPRYFGEAIFKAGKYMQRLGDAAKSMGYGYIDAVKKLYEVGEQVAVTIKQGGINEETLSKKALADTFNQHLRITSTAELAQLVISVATQVVNEYYSEAQAMSTVNEDVGSTYGFKSQPKGVKNPHEEPLDMVHPRDR